MTGAAGDQVGPRTPQGIKPCFSIQAPSTAHATVQLFHTIKLSQFKETGFESETFPATRDARPPNHLVHVTPPAAAQSIELQL